MLRRGADDKNSRRLELYLSRLYEEVARKARPCPLVITRATQADMAAETLTSCANLVKKLAQTGPSEAELEGTRMKRPNPQRDGPHREKPCLPRSGKGG